MATGKPAAKPVAILRSGCGWLVAYDDGRVRCTHPGNGECPGPHVVEVDY